MSEKIKLDALLKSILHDFDALCEEGGGICDWTMIAIHADDGLNPVVKESFTTEKGKP